MGTTSSKPNNNVTEETNNNNSPPTAGAGAAQSNGDGAQEKPIPNAADAGIATEFTGEQFPEILKKTTFPYPVHKKVAQFLDDKELRAVHATQPRDSMFASEREHRILNKFLVSVARGAQDKAENLLKIAQKPGGVRRRGGLALCGGRTSRPSGGAAPGGPD